MSTFNLTFSFIVLATVFCIVCAFRAGHVKTLAFLLFVLFLLFNMC